MRSREPARDIHRYRARGFTLVEVLVALVVLSVGMLGIAGLYLEGLRWGRTSLYRTTAVGLVADMADRIRANPLAGAAYAGTGPGVNGNCVNGGVACTAAELAADDWFTWSAELRQQLPSGAAGQVTVSGTAPVTYLVTVSWPEVGLDEPATYSLSLQP